MQAITPRHMWALIDPTTGRPVTQSALCAVCYNNDLRRVGLLETMARVHGPRANRRFEFKNVTGRKWRTSRLPSQECPTQEFPYTCQYCGYTDGETQFKLKGLVNLLAAHEDQEEDPVFMRYSPSDPSMDGDGFLMRLTGVDTGGGRIVLQASPLRSNQAADGLPIRRRLWGTNINRELDPVFDVDRPQSYGFILRENGVEVMNIYFSSKDARAEYYRVNIADDPDKWFDLMKEIDRDVRGETE